MSDSFFFSTERCMEYEFVYSQPNEVSNRIFTGGHWAVQAGHQFHVTRTDVTVVQTPFTHHLFIGSRVFLFSSEAERI